jgi:DivIVA domain-containing protein
MALTPEDVVNKRFESTKFREGYDQDDVDDFLDEVVVELRRLNQENDELRHRLTAAEAFSSELQQSARSAVAAPAAMPAPAAVERAPAVQPASSALDDANNTNNLLQLARRLHEEHVREGIAKRDALIAEGQATAEKIVAGAESQQREQYSSLVHEREALERRIESLQNFEREYRQKLKSYIQGQLHELDSASLVSAGTSAPDSRQQSPAPAAQLSAQSLPGNFAAPQSAQQPPASFTGYSVN